MKSYGLVGCAILIGVPAAIAKPMTAAELKATVVGHSVHWKGRDGKGGVTTYNADGTITATVDGKSETYQGKWRIKNNQMCENWGKWKCSTHNALGDGKYSIGDGTYTIE